jgi:regulatory protein
MKITSIKFLKNSYELTIEPLNEQYRVTAELMVELRLINNREITPEEYSSIRVAGMIHELLTKILNKINFRMRSTQEVKQMLQDNKADDYSTEYIINHLIKNKYLNDELFKKLYISDAINLTDKGPKLLVQELSNHNIKCDINDIFNQEDFEQKRINNIIDKKLKIAKGSKYSVKQRIIKYLLQRGYSYEKIRMQIDKADYSELKSLRDDYTKISYKVLDEKKLMQKLQAKGYKYENIRFIMEEKNENS